MPQMLLPRDANSAPIHRAMGVPEVRDDLVMISGSKFVDVFSLDGDRVFHGISIYNPSAAASIEIAIGPEGASNKCIVCPPATHLTFDNQTFGAIFDEGTGVARSTRVRAKLSGSLGTAATGTLTFGGQPSDGQVVNINGFVYEFSNDMSPQPGRIKVDIGGDLNATMANLVIQINANDQLLTASHVGGVLTLTSTIGGADANALAFDAGTTSAVASGATLSGAASGVTPLFHIW